MNDHYYSEKPNTISRPKTWEVELRDVRFRFTSDEGVFSKRGVDFGSRLLVETFRFPEIAGPLLDMGCGYGAIGVALAKTAPSRQILMADVNERAVHLAKKNAADNGVANVSVFSSDLFEHVQATEFAAIVTNPPIRAGKKVVYQLFEGAYAYLAPGGEFWAVIQKKQGAPSALKKLRAVFPEVTVEEKKKGYTVIRSKKTFDSN